MEIEVKPLSSNGFIAFFQRIYRWWLSVWYSFSDKHPKFASLLYKVGFFFAFSMAVTVWQFIIMTFLPYAFTSTWGTPFCWPRVELPFKDAAGNALYFGIFNEPAQFVDAAGKTFQAYTETEVQLMLANPALTLKAGGLGNFIAFEIAVFTAQCINFPLQRNITYKSKGNPYFQALMYFVGWVGVSILTNAIWGIANPLLLSWNMPDVVIGLLKTFLTGGVSMFIFFFIFLLIFPNLENSAKSLEKRYEKAKDSDMSDEKKEALHQKALAMRKRADEENARLAVISTSSIADSKAINYHSCLTRLNKMKDEKGDANEIAELEKLLNTKLEEAINAKKRHEEAVKVYNSLHEAQ